MRNFLALCTACLVSLLGYLILFGFVVSRPMVVDQLGEFMAWKQAYASATPHPKLFVVAGSNARMSHSCAVLEEMLGRPCVNMGITAEAGLDWTLNATKKNLAAGDLVYLPIEYGLYSVTREHLYTLMDAAYRFRHDKPSLAERGPEGALRAAFMFNVSVLVKSLGETALNAAGVRRRFNLRTLDKQGDETGHDGDKALPYVSVIKGYPEEAPDPAHLMDNPDGSQAALANFLDWCRDHGVTAVGGLPTIFDDRPVPDAVIARLRAFYASHRAQFIVLPNRSQYPRTSFYDTGYHLRQSAQIVHTRLLAPYLKAFLPR
jgi:hypothetical protein